MSSAGLGDFVPSSTRGSSSSTAALSGISVDHLISSVGWSRPSTFVRFYMKSVESLTNLSIEGPPVRDVHNYTDLWRQNVVRRASREAPIKARITNFTDSNSTCVSEVTPVNRSRQWKHNIKMLQQINASAQRSVTVPTCTVSRRATTPEIIEIPDNDEVITSHVKIGRNTEKILKIIPLPANMNFQIQNTSKVGNTTVSKIVEIPPAQKRNSTVSHVSTIEKTNLHTQVNVTQIPKVPTALSMTKNPVVALNNSEDCVEITDCENGKDTLSSPAVQQTCYVSSDPPRSGDLVEKPADLTVVNNNITDLEDVLEICDGDSAMLDLSQDLILYPQDCFADIDSELSDLNTSSLLPLQDSLPDQAFTNLDLSKNDSFSDIMVIEPTESPISAPSENSHDTVQDKEYLAASAILSLGTETSARSLLTNPMVINQPNMNQFNPQQLQQFSSSPFQCLFLQPQIPTIFVTPEVTPQPRIIHSEFTKVTQPQPPREPRKLRRPRYAYDSYGFGFTIDDRIQYLKEANELTGTEMAQFWRDFRSNHQ